MPALGKTLYLLKARTQAYPCNRINAFPIITLAECKVLDDFSDPV